MDEMYADGGTGHSTGSGTYSVDGAGAVQIAIDTVDGQPENVIFSGHLSSGEQLMALTSGSGTTVNPGGGGGGGCFIRALQ